MEIPSTNYCKNLSNNLNIYLCLAKTSVMSRISAITPVTMLLVPVNPWKQLLTHLLKKEKDLKWEKSRSEKGQSSGSRMSANRHSHT
jgi:hypothetical protein